MLHYRGNTTENFDPQVICQCSGISVVHLLEMAENSLKKRTNFLCLFPAIPCYSVYVMAITNVTRPCYCLGSLQTSFNRLGCPEISYCLPHGRQCVSIVKSFPNETFHQPF